MHIYVLDLYTYVCVIFVLNRCYILYIICICKIYVIYIYIHVCIGWSPQFFSGSPRLGDHPENGVDVATPAGEGEVPPLEEVDPWKLLDLMDIGCLEMGWSLGRNHFSEFVGFFFGYEYIYDTEVPEVIFFDFFLGDFGC